MLMDTQSKWQWCIDNKKLFYKLYYRKNDLKRNFEDVYPDLCLIALEGFDKYNSKKNMSLSTFIFNYVSQRYLRLAMKDKLVCLPLNMANVISFIKKHKVIDDNGHIDSKVFRQRFPYASDKFISDVEEVMKDKLFLDIDLINEMNSRDKAKFVNMKNSIDSIEEKLDRENDIKKVNLLLSCFSPRKKQILDMYFGLNKYKDNPMTYIQIGNELGISYQRVSQIVKKIITFIKSNLKESNRNVKLAAIRKDIYYNGRSTIK